MIPVVNIFVPDENETMKLCNVDNLKYASVEHETSLLHSNEKPDLPNTIPAAIKEISLEKLTTNIGISTSAEVKTIPIETIDFSINVDNEVGKEEVPIENIVAIKSFIDVSVNKSKFYTRTATLLCDILPEENQLIRKFDKQRNILKSIKNNDRLLAKTMYMDTLAQLEVKVINKEYNLKAELGK